MKDVRFSEEIQMKGNFWFLYNINNNLYNRLSSAEKVARTDFRQCGKNTRDILEDLVSIVISKHDLENKSSNFLNLYDKINFLKKEGLLPSLGIVRVDYEDGSTDKIDYYDFLRKFSNASSHAEVKPKNPKINYDHVCKALKGYHLLVKKYYSKLISKDTPGFMENYMPIGEYFIEDSYVPVDSPRSKCIREFHGHKLDINGRKKVYAILRLYRKDDLDTDFLLRNSETFTEAARLSISAVPEGMTNSRELIPYNSNNSIFYIMAYDFYQRPHKLKKELLRKMDLGQRVLTCKKIADCFFELHKSEIPIYHRMLSDESLALCHVRGIWVPYIIKFDFAKISFIDINRTLKHNAIKASKRLMNLAQIKFLAPEWEYINNSSKVDWGKIDIYSLGILFADILWGNIDNVPVDIDDLEDLDISDELLDLLDIMRADTPGARPDIDKVLSILKEEAILWS